MRLLLAVLMTLSLLPAHSREPTERQRLDWHAYEIAVAEAPGDAHGDLLMLRYLPLTISGLEKFPDNDEAKALRARAEVVAAKLRSSVDAVRDTDPFLLAADLGCSPEPKSAVCAERRARLETFAALRKRYRSVSLPSTSGDGSDVRPHAPDEIALMKALTLSPVVQFSQPCRQSEERELREYCLAVAEEMAHKSQIFLEIAIAQSVVEALGSPADVQSVRAARRDLQWLQARTGQLMLASEFVTSADSREYFDVFASHGEIAAMRTLLEIHGIPTTSPEGWTRRDEQPNHFPDTAR